MITPNTRAFILLQLFRQRLQSHCWKGRMHIMGIHIVWIRIMRPHLNRLNFKRGARTVELSALPTLRLTERLKNGTDI